MLIVHYSLRFRANWGNLIKIYRTPRYARSLIALLLSFTVSTVFAFEGAPEAHISKILSSKEAQSVYHRVEEVQLIGREYQFYVETQFAGYNIQSMPLLRDSIKEITIVGDALSQFSRQSQHFSDELRGQLEIRAESVIDIISRPVQSVANLAGQAADNLDETFTDPFGGAKRSTYRLQGQASSDPTFAMHKRNVANQWGLDVYSSNPKVQEFLNAVARQRGAGSISAGAPSLGLSRIKKTKLENQTIDFGIKSSLKRLDIDQLYLSNHSDLTLLGVQSDIRDRFLQHPFYSPSYQTYIIHYLKAVTGLRNINAFFAAALKAENLSDARSVLEQAMQLVYYHNNYAQLRMLNVVDAQLQVISTDNILIVFPRGDIFFWDRDTANMLTAVSQRASNAGFNSIQLVTSGKLTSQAKTELTKQQFTIFEAFGL